MLKIPQHTPEPWYWEAEEGGDSSVGAPPSPAGVYVDPEGSAESVVICELMPVVVTLDRAHWTLADYKQKLAEIESDPDADYYEYGPGVHELGSPNANAERIAICVNFCAGKTNAELAALGSLLAIIQKHNDFVEGQNQSK